MNRREALATAAAAAAAGAAPACGQPPRAKPRIGSVSWNFHGFEPGADPREAIETIGRLGFDGLDLILNAREDLNTVWSDARIGEVRRLLERHRLEVAQFVLFQPVVEGLTSPDADERKRNLDWFERGCVVGRKLGAPIVDIVAPWPRELRRPGGGYLPRHYELPNARPGDRFQIEIAPGFDWDRIWAEWLATVRECLARARAHGLKLTIEHHTHCLVPDAVSFLRMWDAIRDPNLGYNLDTGWTLLQREHPAVAIHKTRRHLMNLHVRDIDGLMRSFVHVGTGVMDFRAIAEALKAVGYTGFLSIEQDRYPGEMHETCRRYLAMMREYLR